MRQEKKRIISALLATVLLEGLAVAVPADRASSKGWKPIAGAMLTPWGENLDPSKVWKEYPRPQMARDQWTNLNGLWEYAVTGKEAGQPGLWTGEILVPFAIEAPLSGVGRRVSPEEALWYRRTMAVEKKAGRRYLLNFEAVDYQSTLWVNGKQIGSHTGGNLPFSFDITAALKVGDNTLVLRVLDATDAKGTYQLHGKQKTDNKGIWYTPVSGIWQTVWMESVPSSYIESLKIDTKVSGEIRLTPVIKGSGTIRSEAFLDGKKVAEGGDVLHIARPKLWTPATPNLYSLKVQLLDDNGRAIDCVASYAGIREVGKAKDADGHWRFTLNGEMIFHWGPLDQGWWPDGLLTPPSVEAMVSDIHFLRDAGFNMIRKHIKVEPRRYYYECDRLGMMVWQDQVSGGAKPKWTRLAVTKKNPPKGTPLDAEWPDAAREQWQAEFKGMVDHLCNHPSIVVWTPFNESWGQHRTMEIGKWIEAYDPSRLVNIASGGNFLPVGDIADEHNYPHPAFPLDQPEYDAYIKVVGEFGGHGWPVDGHLWNKEKRNWGYGGLPQTVDEYKTRYRQSIRTLAELKARAIAAGVYTQTTDVEGEINGLITYDRKVRKMSAAELKEIHETLKRPPLERTTVFAAGKDAPQMWKYTTEQPAGEWNRPGFDDAAWKQGPAGFGAKGTPNAKIKTGWKTQDIWLRKEFELQEDGGFLELEMYYDEDPVIYINGIKAAEPKGYTTGYVSMALSDQAAAALTKGKNTIAVHCRNTRGGQFIDLGLIHFIDEK